MFHDFVSKGKILPVRGIRGFYRLNESLKLLGLREVPCLPLDASIRSIEDILRLALTMIDPAVFPMPPWAVVEEEWDRQEMDHVKHLAEMHREAIESLGKGRLLGWRTGCAGGAGSCNKVRRGVKMVRVMSLHRP